jgi:hypothetical protein
MSVGNRTIRGAAAWMVAGALSLAVQTVGAQETTPPANQEPPASPSPPPPPAEPVPPPPVESTPPVASSKVFNPDISVIGNFVGATGTNDSEFAMPGLELSEAEVAFQAAVDPYARADFFFAFGAEGAEAEEGYITFPTLPGGFLLKVGKMRASFGKMNQMHSHVVRWVDRPLVTQSLLGGEEGISDAGLSLARLFPNSLLFLEGTAEVFAGNNAVFQAPRRKDLTFVGRLRGYRDLTESTNLDLGTSVGYGHNSLEFAGATTRLVGVDATLRYKPLRRAIYKQFLARTELVWSRREEELDTRSAFGMYVSGEYQIGRRWFAGVRYDRAERAFDPSLKDKGVALILTHSPSEFSLVRAQYRHAKYGDGIKANEVLFQFLFSIGAHGAHPF